MSTIAFVAYPETGHLNPTFKIAKTLKSHGHRVYYLGIPDFEEYICFQDLDFIPIFPDLCPKGFIAHQVGANIDTVRALMAEAERRRQAKNTDLENEIQNLIQQLAPDLVIIDLALPEIALALQKAEVPCLLLNVLCNNFWGNQKYESLAGLPELILCPQEFDFPGTKRKANSYYVEASINLLRREVDFPWDRISDDKPLAYCSFGTQSHLVSNDERFRFMETLISVMAQKQNWQLVLDIGRDMSCNDFNSVTCNVILANSPPQLKLLERASMMITHGGLNSIKECIYFEVPLILYPLIRDQPENAARAVYHGLGLSGDIQEVSFRQLNSFIDRLDKHPSYKTKIKSMSKKFREIEESQPSVRIIETVLQK